MVGDINGLPLQALYVTRYRTWSPGCKSKLPQTKSVQFPLPRLYCHVWTPVLEFQLMFTDGGEEPVQIVDTVGWVTNCGMSQILKL